MPGARRHRYTAWALTWLAYATYYTARKGFSVSKKTIQDQLGVSTWTLGAIDTAYLGAYAVGQFLNGIIGDRVGARRLIGFGMLLSAACCAAFGASSAAVLFGLFFCVNGYAQSTGWPGTTRAMAEWTTYKSRGTVMAFWATCYQVGGIAATAIAGRLLGLYGWRWAFWGPSLIVASVGILVLLLLRSPQTAPPSKPRANEPNPEVEEPTTAAERRAAQRAVIRNKTIWCYGGSYFCIKLIRYSLLFWLPFYLSKAQGYDEETAAYVSTAFEAGGIIGVIVLGIFSDRLRGIPRSGLAAASLVLLAGALLVYALLGEASTGANMLCLGLIGISLFGPDSLLSGAAAQDLGGPNAAATATGFVNGMGSVGAMLQGFVTAGVSKAYGWDKLFIVFVGLALAGSVALVPTLRKPRGATAS